MLSPVLETARATHEGSPQATRDDVLRHLDAAYNLARWLSRNEHDAQDIVQESMLRAVRFGEQQRGESARAWLLQIVRNTCHTWLARNRTKGSPLEAMDDAAEAVSDGDSPELALQRRQDEGAVRRAIELLPAEFREVIVLREIEGLSYKEVAQVASVPIGTVMSRLSRARERLKELLA